MEYSSSHGNHKCLRKLIIGFPRCGNQSHFETYGTASSHDLIYDPNGIEFFQKNFADYEPMILIRANRWEHAYSFWSRSCKMEGETRAFDKCFDEYYEKSDFEKYLKPWRETYPDIEIQVLEELKTRPEFKHIDNFSIPHNWQEYSNTSFISTNN